MMAELAPEARKNVAPAEDRGYILTALWAHFFTLSMTAVESHLQLLERLRLYVEIPVDREGLDLLGRSERLE